MIQTDLLGPSGPRIPTGLALTRNHESRRGRNRLTAIGAESPFRPCEQARGRKGNPAPPFRVFRPAGHETPPAAGHENDRFAVCTKRGGHAPFQHKKCDGGATAPLRALSQYLQPLFRVGRRPFRVPAQRGFRVRRAMGLEESRGDGAAAGGAASRPPPLPTRTGAAGPSRSRFSWLRVAPAPLRPFGACAIIFPYD